MALGSDIDFLSPYYKASVEINLDAAFEDGKQKAISCLQNKIERIKRITRSDYAKWCDLDQPKGAGSW